MQPQVQPGPPHSRGGTYTKSLVTCLGEIRFKAKKIIRRSDDKTATPILEVLNVKRRRHYRDVRMRLAEFASKMSYGDTCLEFETATGVHVPERTIHGFVGEIAPRLLEASRVVARAEVVIGDSIKVRARLSREMNNVRVLISGGGRLLSLKVNEEWPRAEADVLVSDGEPGLVNAIDARAGSSASSTPLKHLLLTLWREGMSHEDRYEADEAVRHIVFPLVYSLAGILRIVRSSEPG